VELAAFFPNLIAKFIRIKRGGEIKKLRKQQLVELD
jgi:hypothetical protein